MAGCFFEIAIRTSRHPRGYGTFAKVIREHVLKRKALPLVEAVRKMTGLPASVIRLDAQKRGLLRAGWAADVLVFDQQAVVDHSTYEQPNRLATGMSRVLVNGHAAIADGKISKRRGGKLLLRR